MKVDRGTKHNVDDAESNATLVHNHLRSKRRVAIGVIDEFFKIDVGMMNQIALQNARVAGHFHIFMNGAKFKLGKLAFDQSEFAVGIISSALDPFIQIKISARHEISIELRRG